MEFSTTRNIPRNEKQPQQKINRCSLSVCNLPLERFVLPTDGRKAKQLARTRAALLLYLASFANGDGTFANDERNFSPSLKRLTKQFARTTLFERLNDLWDLALLPWTRPDHYSRRTYTIDPTADHPTVDQVAQLRKNRFAIRGKQVRYSSDSKTEQVRPAD
jgi:hypothetical protein